MTTQESLLALAQAVYPNRAFRADGVRIVYEAKTSWVSLMGPVSSITDVAFDPANNSEQAMEVLCWLMAQHPQHKYDGDDYTSSFEFAGMYIHQTILLDSYEAVAVWSCSHYKTPASLRSAIVQAACRVVGG